MTTSAASGDEPLLWRRRDLTLPQDLERAIERRLGSVPASRWTAAARALSDRYRGEREPGGTLLSGGDDALGYLAMMMPATYAQLRGAMALTAERLPGWKPGTLLDLGTGTGAAVWAAVEQWSSLRHVVATDRERALLAIARELAREAKSAPIRETTWTGGDVRRLAANDDLRFDLVVIGHVLNELTLPEREDVVRRAWALTAGVLLVVEPGTPQGFADVRGARDQLLMAGAHTIAPCAHDRPCPLAANWCHFPQRITRPAFQRRARGAPGQWEDAKYSLAAMSRSAAGDALWGRVIGEPRANKAIAEVLLSTDTGVVRVQAQKRDREQYDTVRQTAWGDGLAGPFPAPVRRLMVDPLPDMEVVRLDDA